MDQSGSSQQDEPHAKKKRWHDDTGRHHSTWTPKVSVEDAAVEEDEYDYWLVRKPTSVRTDQLDAITFPKKVKPTVKRVELEEADGSSRTLSCSFKKPKKQMLYLTTQGVESTKQLRSIRPTTTIRGMLTVHEVMPLEDGLPVVPEENFLEPEGAEDEEQPGASLNFTSIRRKPKLRLGHLKERLKAFGAERFE
ncbi:hypothetical protein AAVH_05496 [Aphelenchoides avenae]|nr:hypothetical protein AAVH_05496 [Aphelenchus avenae]